MPLISIETLTVFFAAGKHFSKNLFTNFPPFTKSLSNAVATVKMKF